MSHLEAYEKWLKSPMLSEAERGELLEIISDDNEIKSRFFSGLEFGTAGLRGVLGLGTSRMNIHVVRHATQAFAEVINESVTAPRSIGICYDCRHLSREFAEAATEVMAANGIAVSIDRKSTRLNSSH